MASCTVYKTYKQYKVIAESLTTTGLLITSEPLSIIDIGSDKSELWLAIMNSLKAFRTGVVHPRQDQWKEMEKQTLRMLKETSYSKLYKNATVCSVTLEGTSLSLTRYIFEPKYRGLVVDKENEYQYTFNEGHEEIYINKLLELLNI